MKRFAFMASTVLMTTFVACTVDTTPKGEAPASNEITLDVADLSDLRPGEVVTATMVIPTGGKNILSEERGWKVDNETIFTAPYNSAEYIIGSPSPVISVKEEGGKSILKFYCDAPGEHTIVYYTRYNWKGVTDGATYKDVEVKKTITAISGDIYGSKWGDNIDKTLKVYSSAEKVSDNVYGCKVSDALSSLDLQRYFTFTDGKLSKIEEYFSTKSSASSLYNLFVRWNKNIQSRQGFTDYISAAAYRKPDGEVVYTDDDKDKIKQENEKLLNGQLEAVHTEWKKAGTKAEIDCWTTLDPDGARIFNFSRTYTPAN